MSDLSKTPPARADETAGEGSPPSTSLNPAKRAYQKPAFVFERAFETMALSCGKVNFVLKSCKFNTKNS